MISCEQLPRRRWRHLWQLDVLDASACVHHPALRRNILHHTQAISPIATPKFDRGRHIARAPFRCSKQRVTIRQTSLLLRLHARVRCTHALTRVASGLQIRNGKKSATSVFAANAAVVFTECCARIVFYYFSVCPVKIQIWYFGFSV